MKKDLSYHDFIVYDIFNDLPEVTSRHMMSGWCIYSNKIPFAAIIGNQLYLKAKGEHAERLVGLGWTKFSYTKSDGKVVGMNYYQVPDELLDNQESLLTIARDLLG
ncbi:MAG: TfoX/Sxy family protein [Candidatus Taylorbacteria bacterium]|nr:TfoX/Sxy family protein [Candidatus Taylorbacteria bacterium]